MKKIDRLPDTELLVMKAIWNNDTPISTSQIKDYLDMDRAWNISALQTLLNRLIAREFLSSEKNGKNRFYEPLVSEEEYIARENKSFLERLNSNSLTKFVTSLYDSQSISDEDLEELANYIEAKRKGEEV